MKDRKTPAMLLENAAINAEEAAKRYRCEIEMYERHIAESQEAMKANMEFAVAAREAAAKLEAA